MDIETISNSVRVGLSDGRTFSAYSLLASVAINARSLFCIRNQQ